MSISLVRDHSYETGTLISFIPEVAVATWLLNLPAGQARLSGQIASALSAMLFNGTKTGAG